MMNPPLPPSSGVTTSADSFSVLIPRTSISIKPTAPRRRSLENLVRTVAVSEGANSSDGEGSSHRAAHRGRNSSRGAHHDTLDDGLSANCMDCSRRTCSFILSFSCRNEKYAFYEGKPLPRGPRWPQRGEA